MSKLSGYGWLLFALLGVGTIVPITPAAANTPTSLPALETLLSGDPDDAEDFIENHLKRFPNDAKAHFYRGNIMGLQAANSTLWALSYAGKALKSFEKAVQLEPQHYEYRMGLASFHIAAPGIAGGDKEEAWRQIEALRAFDAFHASQLELSYWRAVEDDVKDAAERYQQAEQQALALYPLDARLLFRLGMSAQTAKDYPLALQRLQACANADQLESALANPHIIRYQDTAELMRQAQVACLYQVGRTVLLSESADSAQLAAGITALQAFLAIESLPANVPPHDWARLRLAGLYLLAQQPEQTRQLLAQVKPSDDLMKKEHQALSKQLR